MNDQTVEKLTNLGWTVKVSERLISFTNPTGIEYNVNNDAFGWAFGEGVCCGAVGQEMSWQVSMVAAEYAGMDGEDARDGEA